MSTAFASPPKLPTGSVAERLASFERATVHHPQFDTAKQRIIHAIETAPPNTLVLLYGSPGVGKSRLLETITRQLIASCESGPHKDAMGSTRVPVVLVEAIAPARGNFTCNDLFKEILIQIGEPLADKKLKHPAEFRPSRLSTSANCTDLQYAVESALRLWRPQAILVDEAQHLARVAAGRSRIQQLDVLKSVANRASTIHVLAGDYRLLSFRNLSGQLSRRSIDVHFRRYHAENESDRGVFIKILEALKNAIPLPEPPDLVAIWEYLYERSIGCVGVLASWIRRALADCLVSDGNRMTLRHFERTALSASQCERMLLEATAGEDQLVERVSTVTRLRASLGVTLAQAERNQPQVVATRNMRPGKRIPRPDPIGVADT